MEYKKDLFILEFYNGIVSCVNNSMKKLLFAYVKSKKDLMIFFLLILLLICCLIESYSIISELGKISIIFAIVLFVFIYWFLNKKPKEKGEVL